MDFALSEEQSAIFDMAKAFGEEHIAPHAMAWEKAGTIPKGKAYPKSKRCHLQVTKAKHPSCLATYQAALPQKSQ